MPKLAEPLTDAQIKHAQPMEKTYALANGCGMYLEVKPTGSKRWRKRYRQTNAKTIGSPSGHTLKSPSWKQVTEHQ